MLIKITSLALLAAAYLCSSAWAGMGGKTDLMKAQPVFEREKGANFRFEGFVGERIKNNQRNWLLTAPLSNPSMLQMFRDRDKPQSRDLLPWSGEFAGKYLISAVQGYRITKDRQLRDFLRGFVAELISTQAEDGYLGVWPNESRLFKPGPWDLWSVYHVMLGLYIWSEETGDEAALKACLKSADLICKMALDEGKRTIEADSYEMNQSCIHIFTLLYEKTGNERYLRMAKEIEKDWQTPPSGDYIRTALAGKAFYQCPKPRWESLPGLQAIGELYYITGDEKYRTAFINLWKSIAKYDRHNTGGFSSGEQAVGNPYDPGAIETCCTVAWMALTVDMLRLTGDSRAADELELTFFNGGIGAQDMNGRWWTYNTPMDGVRRASAHDIVFQAMPGSPELNCCSCNAPRILGCLSDWAVMKSDDGVVLNYYGESVFEVPIGSSGRVKIAQKTDYPRDGYIRLIITPDSQRQFALRLRIPCWSKKTVVKLNKEPIKDVTSGTYLVIERTWKQGDEVEIEFDMSPRFWVKEPESEKKASIYLGPILMAYDQRYDVYEPHNLPAIQPKSKVEKAPDWVYMSPPMMLRRFSTTDGRKITLCDFASAGMGGNKYVSWLNVEGLKPVPFDIDSPFRGAE